MLRVVLAILVILVFQRFLMATVNSFVGRFRFRFGRCLFCFVLLFFALSVSAYLHAKK